MKFLSAIPPVIFGALLIVACIVYKGQPVQRSASAEGSPMQTPQLTYSDSLYVEVDRGQGHEKKLEEVKSVSLLDHNFLFNLIYKFAHKELVQ